MTGNEAAIYLKDKVRVSRHQLILFILHLKLCVEKQYSLSNNELAVLSLFLDTDDKDTVIQEALDKEYVKSRQSAENMISRMVVLELLDKADKKKRKISKWIDKEIFPSNPPQYIVANLTLHNTNAGNQVQ